MSHGDIILVVVSALGALVIFIVTVVILALKIQLFIITQNTVLREFIVSELKKRDNAILNWEMWAVRHDKTGDFQPGGSFVETPHA